jgi:hypothetical protein
MQLDPVGRHWARKPRTDHNLDFKPKRCCLTRLIREPLLGFIASDSLDRARSD